VVRLGESRDHFLAGFPRNCRICRRTLYSIMLVPDYWYNPLAADAARDGRYGNQHVRATHSPSRLYQVSYECNKIRCHSPVCARLVSLYRLSVFVICHFNNIINYTVSRIDNEFLKKIKNHSFETFTAHLPAFTTSSHPHATLLFYLGPEQSRLSHD